MILTCSVVLQKIVTTIGEKMKKRPISLKVFKCMKCSTHFSQDTEYVTVISSSISGRFLLVMQNVAVERVKEKRIIVRL